MSPVRPRSTHPPVGPFRCGRCGGAPRATHPLLKGNGHYTEKKDAYFILELFNKKNYKNYEGSTTMIGIMADSHDNLDAIKQAVRIFNDTGCEMVIHAGDFVAPFSARELKDLSCPVKAIFGNCDGEKEGLRRAFHALGEIQKAPFIFTWDSLAFLITHDHTSVPAYLSSRSYDIIIFGHTHKPEIRQEKRALLLNPGETGGWLSGKRTVALLDPTRLSAEIISL